MVMQLVSTIMLTVLGITNNFVITTPQELTSFLQTILCASLIVYTILGIVFYLVSHYMLKNKLNLE